jgi:hypothetical protein
MLAGIGLIGVLTATFASYFVGQDADKAKAEQEELRQELVAARVDRDRLERKLDRLSQQMEQMLRGSSRPSAEPALLTPFPPVFDAATVTDMTEHLFEERPCLDCQTLIQFAGPGYLPIMWPADVLSDEWPGWEISEPGFVLRRNSKAGDQDPGQSRWSRRLTTARLTTARIVMGETCSGRAALSTECRGCWRRGRRCALRWWYEVDASRPSGPGATLAGS